jgi:PAS domain S-box-containing protein
MTSIETSLYRNEIDKRLKKSEMKFRILFEQSRDASFVSDNEGNFVNINQSMLNLFGYSKKEFLKKNIFKLFSSNDDADSYKKILDENGYITRFETKLSKKNRNKIICLINSNRIFDDWNNQTGIQGIIRDITEIKGMEKERELLLHNLSVRIKELNCLFSLSNLVEKPGVQFDEILHVMVEVMRISWQYPDISCARIIYNEREYRSKNFKITKWKQSSDIFVDNEKLGIIEVYYTKKMPDIYEGPFMEEERALIDAVASRLGRYVERENAYDNLKKSHFELRNLSVHLQSVREEERTRISREIHDELGQSLTALKMDLSWMEKKICHEDEDLIKKSISMLELVDSTIDTVRRISSDLRPGILDDLGLFAAIEWQAGEIEQRSNIKINCDIPPEYEEAIWNDDHKISLFRIFQEAMTNIVRHSKATEAEVTIKKEDNIINFLISDNGIGITDDQINYTKSCGIIGIRERVNYCGGTLDISGAKNRGTTIRISIPVEKSN